jgi:hypothetical protein
MNFVPLDLVFSNGEKEREASFFYPLDNDCTEGFSVVYQEFKLEGNKDLVLKVTCVEEDLIEKEN